MPIYIFCFGIEVWGCAYTNKCIEDADMQLFSAVHIVSGIQMVLLITMMLLMNEIINYGIRL